MNGKIRKFRSDCGFICQFAMDDFKTKYAGSILGLIWAFIQPVITVIIYWFVFQKGFKNQEVGEYPFILWLISGLAPWFFFSDSISNATSSLVDYSYLVKKVLFNINILPVARISSVLFVQVFIMLFTEAFYLGYGFLPTVKILQIIYYLFYMFVICAGIVYLTSALYVFFKDIIQIVSIILQIIFWTTPIVWQLNVFDKKIQDILSFNPLFYPVRGYRDALMEGKWFWEYDISQTIYYWGVALVFCALGFFVFNKLKQHFADVL